MSVERTHERRRRRRRGSRKRQHAHQHPPDATLAHDGMLSIHPFAAPHIASISLPRSQSTSTESAQGAAEVAQGAVTAQEQGEVWPVREREGLEASERVSRLMLVVLVVLWCWLVLGIERPAAFSSASSAPLSELDSVRLSTALCNAPMWLLQVVAMVIVDHCIPTHLNCLRLAPCGTPCCSSRNRRWYNVHCLLPFQSTPACWAPPSVHTCMLGPSLTPLCIHSVSNLSPLSIHFSIQSLSTLYPLHPPTQTGPPTPHLPPTYPMPPPPTPHLPPTYPPPPIATTISKASD
jgi:hypothetical protein